MRKTKIICTLGPSTDDENILRQLIIKGMDVARINMSHQDQESQKKRIESLKKLRKELDIPVALLLDTKGPEIRIGKFADSKVTLKKGQKFVLTTRDVLGNKEICSVTFKGLTNDVKEDSKILIDDGLIELNVERVTDTDIVCIVLNGGELSANKGINIPNACISLPFLSEKDCSDVKFAVEQDFDFIAASFTRSADDIMMLRSELSKNHCKDIKIIAKIENAEGVRNIDDIIELSDGIMVARGDLGVEIPLEDIPIIQKDLIQKVNNEGKQIIIATQMLDSMIKNPRPTRAECTDVANAIYDGTSAIMLSGETAAGDYPIEAVSTMAKIAERTEEDIDYVKRFKKKDVINKPNVTSALSRATCTIAHDLNATAIITVSVSGRTARMVSKYRPKCPIIAGTKDPKVQRQMNLLWGVTPILIENKKNTDDLLDHIIDMSERHNLVKSGDLVVITTGVPLGVSGTTNLVKAHLVGNVLVSGTSINASDKTIYGNVCVCESVSDVDNKFKPGDILVIHQTTNAILDAIKNSSGIIVEAPGLNSHAAVVGLALNKPTIIGAENATKLLKSGTTVMLDSKRGIVFSGVK